MTDNLAPFQRFLDQFDTFGSDSMPPTGWPLSPMPIPGSGGAGLDSAESTTKQAVKRLYAALDTLSDSQSTGTDSAVWSQYLDAFDLGDASIGPEELTAATLRSYRVWFFSLTQLLVESYTLRLVHDQLVVEDHRHSTGTQEWLWGTTQSDREQLLRRCTEVSDELIAEMKALRQRRNKLLYTFGGWDEVDFDESRADARRSLTILTALDDYVTDGAPFSYMPEKASEDRPASGTDDTAGGTDDTDRSDGG